MLRPRLRQPPVNWRTQGEQFVDLAAQHHASAAYELGRHLVSLGTEPPHHDIP
ncbi:hypothetical protein ACWCWQ_28330 [Streptomyces sp. NPDC001571]